MQVTKKASSMSFWNLIKNYIYKNIDEMAQMLKSSTLLQSHYVKIINKHKDVWQKKKSKMHCVAVLVFK